MLASSDSGSITLVAASAVLLAPLSEEIFFRGYVLPSLTKWMHPAAAVRGLAGWLAEGLKGWQTLHAKVQADIRCASFVR